jgi:hypothetical protein
VSHANYVVHVFVCSWCFRKKVAVYFVFCFSEELREQIGSTCGLQMLHILGPGPCVRYLKVVLRGHDKDSRTYRRVTAYNV